MRERQIDQGRFVLALAEDGEREGEEEDQEYDQNPERHPLSHLVSSLRSEPSGHSSLIREARPASGSRPRSHIMYNVAMCSRFRLEGP